MKNIITLVGFTVLFFSCKEKQNTQNSSNKETENQGIITKTIPLKTISTEEIQSDFSINNDTLYIYNFWATWCPPCREEIPYFVNAQEFNKSNKVKIKFISLDEYDTQTSVQEFVNKAQMKNSFILKSNTPSDILKIVPELNSIPVTIFIKKGKKETIVGGMAENDFKMKIQQGLQ